MINNLFLSFLATLGIVIIGIILVPLISLLVTVIDTLIIKRKSKVVKKKMNIIMKKQNEIVNDFNNCRISSAIRKEEELMDLGNDLSNYVNELKKEEQ